jgi:phage terminase small subunit
MPRKNAKKKAQKPLEYLLAVMNDETVDEPLRVRAAIAAAQYCHAKRDDGGKKEERQSNAVDAARGKLALAAPPKLAIVK